jgi:hypothetical protein
LENWFKKGRIVRVTNAKQAIKQGRAGRTAYMDHITAAHPNYLHEMFRTATQLVKDDTTFDLPTRTMNLHAVALENMPTLTLDNKEELLYNLMRSGSIASQGERSKNTCQGLRSNRKEQTE